MNITEEEMEEFKEFVDKAVEEELDIYEYYDEEGVGQREKHVKEVLDYKHLLGLSYRDYFKGFHNTARHYIIEDIFYS